MVILIERTVNCTLSGQVIQFLCMIYISFNLLLSSYGVLLVLSYFFFRMGENSSTSLNGMQCTTMN